MRRLAAIASDLSYRLRSHNPQTNQGTPWFASVQILQKVTRERSKEIRNESFLLYVLAGSGQNLWMASLPRVMFWPQLIGRGGSQSIVVEVLRMILPSLQELKSQNENREQRFPSPCGSEKPRPPCSPKSYDNPVLSSPGPLQASCGRFTRPYTSLTTGVQFPFAPRPCREQRQDGAKLRSRKSCPCNEDEVFRGYRSGGVSGTLPADSPGRTRDLRCAEDAAAGRTRTRSFLKK